MKIDRDDGAREIGATEPANARDGRCWRRQAPLLFILAGLCLGTALGWGELLSLASLAESRAMLKTFVNGHPLAAPAAFVLLYAVAVAFAFPASSILTVIGGFLFGWVPGALYAIVAASSGATGLFLATRSAFGSVLRRRAGGAAGRLAEGFERNAFGYLLVLRIAPFVPFVLVNIAPGLFNVRLKTFLAATLIGILPGAFSYAWLGRGLDSVLEAAQASGRETVIGDLATPEITGALAALTFVTLLAAVVQRWWVKSHPMEGRTSVR